MIGRAAWDLRHILLSMSGPDLDVRVNLDMLDLDVPEGSFTNRLS